MMSGCEGGAERTLAGDRSFQRPQLQSGEKILASLQKSSQTRLGDRVLALKAQVPPPVLQALGRASLALLPSTQLCPQTQGFGVFLAASEGRDTIWGLPKGK